MIYYGSYMSDWFQLVPKKLLTAMLKWLWVWSGLLSSDSLSKISLSKKPLPRKVSSSGANVRLHHTRTLMYRTSIWGKKTSLLIGSSQILSTKPRPNPTRRDPTQIISIENSPLKTLSIQLEGWFGFLRFDPQTQTRLDSKLQRTQTGKCTLFSAITLTRFVVPKSYTFSL